MIRWYLYGLASATIVALVATMLATAGFAPIGVFSLCVGLAIGWLTAKLAALQQIDHGRRLWTGVIVFALATAIAQHAWLYLDYCQKWQQARDEQPSVAIFRPDSWPISPLEYFRLEATPQRVALWSLDAVLILAGAMVAVLLSRRQTIKLNST